MRTRHFPQRLATIPIALAALTGLVGLSACGDDDDAAAAPIATGATATASTTVDQSSGGHHDDAPIVAVGAIDYAFEDLPASVPAGSRLTLTNTSANEVHELVAVAYPEGEDRSAEELMALPPDEVEAIFGAAPPAMVIIAGPGEEGTAVVGDGTLSEPGRYLVVCAIPLGADPDEFFAAASEGTGPPQVEGGPPHFTAGMFAELVVEAPTRRQP